MLKKAFALCTLLLAVCSLHAEEASEPSIFTPEILACGGCRDLLSSAQEAVSQQDETVSKLLAGCGCKGKKKGKDSCKNDEEECNPS